MTDYIWVRESFKKYGDEMTVFLIKQQQEYEAKHIENNCEKCGKNNEGSVIELPGGLPLLMHFGMWTENRCDYCGISRVEVLNYEGAYN